MGKLSTAQLKLNKLASFEYFMYIRKIQLKYLITDSLQLLGYMNITLIPITKESEMNDQSYWLQNIYLGHPST